MTKIEVIDEIPVPFPALTLYNLKNPKANVQLEEIMHYCIFSGEYCTKNDYDLIKDKNGYISYRFKESKTFLAGKNYGLGIIIVNNVSLQENQILTIGEGFGIIAHESTQDPGFYGITNYGKEVSTGYVTNLELTRTVSSKLGEPYNKCIRDVSKVDSHDSDLYKYMITMTNYSYRQKDCFDYCMGREINKFLNESNARIEKWQNILDSFQALNYTPDSKLYKSTFWNAYTNLTKGGIKQVCSPLCPLECESIKYEVSISFSKIGETLQNITFFKSIKRKLNEEEINNALMIYVYYDELRYSCY